MLLQSSSAAIDTYWGWQPIAEAVNRLFNVSRPIACDICGRAPCTNPSFCALCREADRKARSKPPPPRLASRHTGAALSTVEAVMFALRSRGTPALEEPDTQQRLVRLSEDQVRALGVRLQRISPDIAKPWGADKVVALVSKWTSLHG